MELNAELALLRESAARAEGYALAAMTAARTIIHLLEHEGVVDDGFSGRCARLAIEALERDQGGQLAVHAQKFLRHAFRRSLEEPA